MEEGTLALCIQPHKILKSLDTLTVTMEETQMIGREHLGTHFILVQVLCHGIQRNKPSNSIFSRSRVCHNYKRCMSSHLDAENFKRHVAKPAI